MLEKVQAILEHYQLQTELTPFFEYDTGSSYIISVHGNDALPLWYRLRALAAESGLWPVILGPEPSFIEHRYRLQEHREASA